MLIVESSLARKRRAHAVCDGVAQVQMNNKIPKAVHSTPPAEGERRALRGYVGQYEKAGAAIYAALERDQRKRPAGPY